MKMRKFFKIRSGRRIPRRIDLRQTLDPIYEEAIGPLKLSEVLRERNRKELKAYYPAFQEIKYWLKNPGIPVEWLAVEMILVCAFIIFLAVLIVSKLYDCLGFREETQTDTLDK